MNINWDDIPDNAKPKKGEGLKFEHTWNFIKWRYTKNLLDLPEECEIILESIRKTIINTIHSMSEEEASEETKNEWIEIVLRDEEKDKLLEDWWDTPEKE